MMDYLKSRDQDLKFYKYVRRSKLNKEGPISNRFYLPINSQSNKAIEIITFGQLS